MGKKKGSQTFHLPLLPNHSVKLYLNNNKSSQTDEIAIWFFFHVSHIAGTSPTVHIISSYFLPRAKKQISRCACCTFQSLFNPVDKVPSEHKLLEAHTTWFSDTLQQFLSMHQLMTHTRQTLLLEGWQFTILKSKLYKWKNSCDFSAFPFHHLWCPQELNRVLLISWLLKNTKHNLNAYISVLI